MQGSNRNLLNWQADSLPPSHQGNTELKDRIVEITTEQQNKKKWNKDSLRNLWGNNKHTIIQIIGVPEEEKNKGFEKIFEEIIAENFPKMENEIVNQIQEAHSPIQHKPKEKHAKTHTNQTNKD